MKKAPSLGPVEAFVIVAIILYFVAGTWKIVQGGRAPSQPPQP